MIQDHRRGHLYCEHNEGDGAMRMIRADQYKLIWYPVGNRLQLFDLEADPQELHDLSAASNLVAVRDRLCQLLIDELYGTDLSWLQGGKLVGEPDRAFAHAPNRGLSGQRGWR